MKQIADGILKDEDGYYAEIGDEFGYDVAGPYRTQRQAEDALAQFSPGVSVVYLPDSQELWPDW